MDVECGEQQMLVGNWGVTGVYVGICADMEGSGRGWMYIGGGDLG